MKQSRLHLYLTLLWIGLAVPTVIWWYDSILWVLIVSLWANIATHLGAFQSAKAKEAVEETKENGQNE